jgi:2-polyprenyl-3-methyl-5-hydroxy-6-metoxy-1,4-benzoquinol methylase
MITVDFKKISVQPGHRILDIGCGSGRHTCAAYARKRIVVTGADINIKDVKEAKNRLMYHDRLGAHGNGQWNLSVADITCLPFKNHSFDTIICSEVMEHVPDEVTAVQELARVLKPGRRLAVSVPRYLPERICWGLSKAYHQVNAGHIRIYRKKKLLSLFETAGFRTRGFHFAHSLHSPYWWLKCLMGPSREDIKVVNLYHRFLTWDIMQQPAITRFLDHLLNPLFGKSLVVYFDKF